MKDWTISPMLIGLPVILAGCMGGTSSVNTEAVTEAKTAAKTATTTAAPVMAKAAAKVTPASGGIVVNDSFKDGGRTNGSDAADSSWWATTGTSVLEEGSGYLGLVSGGSGRGLRTTFAPQTLADGQTLKASFTFTTPATIGTKRDSALRVGLYNKLGRAGLERDLSASSSSPNALYNGLPGYMIDYDVGLADASKANIDIRKHNNASTGRLLGTTKGYKILKGGGSAYQFAPNQTYTGTIALKKLSTGMMVSGSLSQAGKVLSEFSTMDAGSDVNNIGMLAFHVNSKTFGSSKKKGEPDNGIDLKNVKIEVLK